MFCPVSDAPFRRLTRQRLAVYSGLNHGQDSGFGYPPRLGKVFGVYRVKDATDPERLGMQDKVMPAQSGFGWHIAVPLGLHDVAVKFGVTVA
jgi:hypothetical protein